MVRFFNLNSPGIKGELIVEDLYPGCVEVFFVPPVEKLIQADLDSKNPYDYRVKLLQVSTQDNYLTIFPTNTLAKHKEFLKPKYKQVEEISLVGFDFLIPEAPDSVTELLEELPLGFIKDYDYGLGLLKNYRFIIEAIEELTDCTNVVISQNVLTGIDEASSMFFNMSYDDFEVARESVNIIASKAQESARNVKKTTVFNIFAARLGVKDKPIEFGRHPVTKSFTGAILGNENLGEADQEAVLKALSKNTKVIAEVAPEKLAKLHNDIELVSLEILIERYEAMLGQKLKEDKWQDLFNKNPFILSLAFGYPVIKVKDQASVGGRKLSGSGEKITDFLIKNSLTNNTALFEIKTPQAKLLNKKAYREGIFTPSPDLSGSINQALDQKYQFQKQVAQIKETSRIYDIESYAVHSCLIIGKTPGEVDQQKSFELFRRNSKDVQIVTFDELLEKLRQLLDFLTTEDSSD